MTIIGCVCTKCAAPITTSGSCICVLVASRVRKVAK